MFYMDILTVFQLFIDKSIFFVLHFGMTETPLPRSSYIHIFQNISSPNLLIEKFSVKKQNCKKSIHKIRDLKENGMAIKSTRSSLYRSAFTLTRV